MKLLLDTNALYWLVIGSAQFGEGARNGVRGATLIVSEVSLLELSIKASIGKLEALPGLHSLIGRRPFQRTQIENGYLRRLETLPLLHRDPFDRLLIAQALTDDVAIVTADRRFVEYGVRVVDARE